MIRSKSNPRTQLSPPPPGSLSPPPLPPSQESQKQAARAALHPPFSAIVSRLYEYLALQDILNYVRAAPDPFNYLIALHTFMLQLQDLSFKPSFAEKWRLFRSAWPPRLVAYVEECEPAIPVAVRLGRQEELVWTSVHNYGIHFCVNECLQKQPQGYESQTRVFYIFTFVDALFRPRPGLQQSLFVATSIMDSKLVLRALELDGLDNAHAKRPGIAHRVTAESAIAAVAAVQAATDAAEAGKAAAPRAPANLRRKRRHPHSNAGFKCLFCGMLGHWLRSCPALLYFLDQGALIKCAATGRICFMTGEPMEMYRKGMRHNPAVQQALKNALVATLPRRKELSLALKSRPAKDVVSPGGISVLCFVENHPCTAVIDEGVPFVLVSKAFMDKHKLTYHTTRTLHTDIIPLLRVRPVGWRDLTMINVLGIDALYLVDVVDAPGFDVILGTPWAKHVLVQSVLKPGSPYYNVSIEEYRYPNRSRRWESHPDSDRFRGLSSLPSLPSLA